MQIHIREDLQMSSRFMKTNTDEFRQLFLTISKNSLQEAEKKIVRNSMIS